LCLCVKAAQAVLITLYNLNPEEFMVMLSVLPKTFQVLLICSCSLTVACWCNDWLQRVKRFMNYNIILWFCFMCMNRNLLKKEVIEGQMGRKEENKMNYLLLKEGLKTDTCTFDRRSRNYYYWEVGYIRACMSLLFRLLVSMVYVCYVVLLLVGWRKQNFTESFAQH